MVVRHHRFRKRISKLVCDSGGHFSDRHQYCRLGALAAAMGLTRHGERCLVQRIGATIFRCTEHKAGALKRSPCGHCSEYLPQSCFAAFFRGVHIHRSPHAQTYFPQSKPLPPSSHSVNKTWTAFPQQGLHTSFRKTQSSVAPRRPNSCELKSETLQQFDYSLAVQRSVKDKLHASVESRMIDGGFNQADRDTRIQLP